MTDRELIDHLHSVINSQAEELAEKYEEVKKLKEANASMSRDISKLLCENVKLNQQVKAQQLKVILHDH